MGWSDTGVGEGYCSSTPRGGGYVWGLTWCVMGNSRAAAQRHKHQPSSGNLCSLLFLPLTMRH